jgi:hypothetical protein
MAPKTIKATTCPVSKLSRAPPKHPGPAKKQATKAIRHNSEGFRKSNFLGLVNIVVSIRGVVRLMD